MVNNNIGLRKAMKYSRVCVVYWNYTQIRLLPRITHYAFVQIFLKVKKRLSCGNKNSLDCANPDGLFSLKRRAMIPSKGINAKSWSFHKLRFVMGQFS